MQVAAFLFGIFWLGVALDPFQMDILPRRPASRLRLSRLFYIATWRSWVAATY
jgi:hypothetical protein